MQKKIAIIGLGWLGFPLAESLKKQQYLIQGSTTTTEKLEKLQKNNAVFKVVLTEEKVIGNVTDCLKDCETLILNTPPGLRRNPESNYVKKIENLIPFIEESGIKNVLYISSTSVFDESEKFPVITNKTKTNASKNAGKQIIKVEELLKNNSNFKTTVLRFSGLIDKRRHPVTMMSKRKSIPNPESPTNLIHLNDCIGIIQKIIELGKWDEVYNASYPNHPTKIDYYTTQAQKKKLPLPNFEDSGKSKGKIIDGNETSKSLNYNYKHPIL